MRLSENAHPLRYPHSSGFRKPCSWTFSISLQEAGFSTVFHGIVLFGGSIECA